MAFAGWSKGDALSLDAIVAAMIRSSVSIVRQETVSQVAVSKMPKSSLTSDMESSPGPEAA